DIYRLLLERHNYNVVIRGDAHSGLAWLEQILPDLILLDHMLPGGVSGIEMLHEVRQRPNGREVPIILVTASSHLHPEDLAQYDISAFLRKPIPPSVLLQHIQATLPG
ncbi:MAG: response regulator, partial [Anaerolineales bacterium]